MSPSPEGVFLRYGGLEPQPTRKLKTDTFSASFCDGMLRYVKAGKTEVVRGVYAAVRDHNWNTIPGTFTLLEEVITASSFHIVFESVHRQADIHFRWRGTLSAEGNSITFDFQGEALSCFRRNRIGFCVLHSMDCAGLPCRVTHVDGSFTEGVFPRLISPHQPFFEIRSISHQIAQDVVCTVGMEGDSFEMEDQRNWTDASYKTYCTPLGLPFPVMIDKGMTIEQRVTISLEGIPDDVMADSENVTLSLQPDVRALPKMGLVIAGHGEPLTMQQQKCLKALRLAHLRCDLRLYQHGWLAILEQAKEQAAQLDSTLELALFVSEQAKGELEALVQVLEQQAIPVARYLLFQKDEISTTASWLELARTILKNAPIAVGTDAFFTELNRHRPPVTAEGIVYSLNPQVHAFDHASLVETLAAQAVTLETARGFTGAAINISPITLKMRWNPNATAADLSVGEDLPAQVDVRQLSIFAAAWTLGSLKYLAEAGADSLTYFETTGWLGVMERESDSPLPRLFPSLPGAVFPLYHIFADFSEFHALRKLVSSEPLQVEATALLKGQREAFLIANFSNETQQVSYVDFVGHWHMRVLDERSVLKAMTEPEAYRTERTLVVLESKLTLPPCSVVRLDRV
ncbi:MAG: hypothetical protein GFH24_608416n33 [Chloroflexi bacterium AL-N5]|nr:hypothetical protein [Chloroflexi bacterium AL-N5]